MFDALAPGRLKRTWIVLRLSTSQRVAMQRRCALNEAYQRPSDPRFQRGAYLCEQPLASMSTPRTTPRCCRLSPD